MMFSMEKCDERSTGTSEETELFAGGGEGMGKEGVVSDEVASAVAAVSDEIGDILKEELGDADRADQIGAELAGLSAELGLLAGLADGEAPQDFASRFEVPFEWIAMGHRGSGSGSSSSSWSGARGGRARRPARPKRTARRRPITKGKESGRRVSCGAARLSLRRGAARAASDASDVGADSDTTDQWTELDSASGSSDSSSSMKEAAAITDCNGFQHKGQVEPPAMGQFLLPLLNAEPDHFLIRHEDILQLLTSAEESVRDEIPLDDDASFDPDTPLGESPGQCDEDEPQLTAEEEAALLHYVCDGNTLCECPPFAPVEEWLLGVYHSWCEISALMYTLIGTNMSAEMVESAWVYRARFGCHCALCLAAADNAPPLAAWLTQTIRRLAEAGCSRSAAAVCAALGVTAPDGVRDFRRWDLARLRHARLTDKDVDILHEQLSQLAQQSELTGQMVNKICLCRTYDRAFEKEHAVERFCKLLENFKAASTITFKVEMIPVEGGGSYGWVGACRRRLARFLAPHQRASVADRLADMRARTAPVDLSAWSGYTHRCDCMTPRTLCAQQRKQLLRISFFGMMQAVNECNGGKPGTNADKPPKDPEVASVDHELQQGAGTGAKPPDTAVSQDPPQNDLAADLQDVSEWSGSGSSLDSASELLAESADEPDEPQDLCRTVRHLMRSIASIERLMDSVLKHCDEWPSPPTSNDHEARKRVDLGLSEVDRKLMAMYRRLPEVHRRQLQVYRKQKKLSTVCMQLVGGSAPVPPPPGSPPPAPPPPPGNHHLCPEYHLQRFREVRRKVMHMRDQQLYYHRLRLWLEDQLRQERESVPESNVTLVEELPRRKRRPASPKHPRLATAPKRRLKPGPKPKILHLLRNTPGDKQQLQQQHEVEPPEAFPLDNDISDTETIVDEKETDLCNEMKECLAKFANFALNSPDNNLQEEYNMQVDGTDLKYPETVSPPLQEMSPTTTEPMPVYTPKPSQRLLAVNKLLNRTNEYKEEKVIDFQATLAPDINVPLNARRTPVLVKEETDKDLRLIETDEMIPESENEDPNIYKYLTFGLEIKKAMEDCQNIINSYNNVKDDKKSSENDESPTLEQICEVMMSLDKNSVEFLDKIDDEPLDNNKLAELVENMPQILANMPEIASKLSEFANASFELPEFASIMNSLPDVNNEAQLTPETLKQIRELKLNKSRDNVKVTKNTARRKTNRRIKSNVENDIIGTMTFELDSRDLNELLQDEKDIQALMKNKANNKEDFKDLLFCISAQLVINKVFEYVKQNKNPELAKCLEDEKELFSLPKHSINSEMYSKASTLFDNSVKDALSMDELRQLVKSRFNSWKHYVATKFQSVPVELLENEIEAMLNKFYSYIQDLAEKQCFNENNKILEKIEELRKNGEDSDSEGCAASKESLKRITKLLSTSAGNTFDLLIMKLSKMSQDNKMSVKSLKFKYMDVIRRCSESEQLATWILIDPEIAANVILELTGVPFKRSSNTPDFAKMNDDAKTTYFLDRLKEMNRLYMKTLPKHALSGDEWLVMLYRLEHLEFKLKQAFEILALPPITVVTANTASEAEILAAKGLSKIIGKANLRFVKKSEQKPVNVKPEPEKPEPVKEKVEEKKCKNEALLAKCEAILTSKGEKSLLDSFYTIKSYITQGLPVPETYKKHVISICSSIDAKLLDEDIEETLKGNEKDESPDAEKNPLSVIGTQNSELLAKYSAQALRNAKQTLNAVAFTNMMRNQSKSESDACDTPKTDCKWTNDCICNNCKDTDANVCLGDIVKQCYDKGKGKAGLDQIKAEVKGKPLPVKQAKPVAKACENTNHQQHVCKVGHGASGGCAGEAGADQPCTCCYCTVFGHAPPLTTPVPRNFNETRERLRSILNKKKQKCKATNGEPEPCVAKAPCAPPAEPRPRPHPPAPQPRPPALPKTLPPTLTPAAQQKRQAELQQKQLADRMARMVVTEKTEVKPKVVPRPAPAQAQAPAAPPVKTEGKVNAQAMDHIRMQQLKQQQQAQHQAQLQQQQLLLQQQLQQKKPEPIYDLPIHNKPQQQQQQQQQLLIQRAGSPSSRDTSVFSTSSGCDNEAWWRGGGDPRDLDALLQYIEGPARHVDRGKKRAKKQRQKAKKMEARLACERSELSGKLEEMRRGLEVTRAAHAIERRRVDDLRRALQHLHRTKKKGTGKKQKLNPALQAKVQQMAEQLGELTNMLNQEAKKMHETERLVSDYSRKLQQFDRLLDEARAVQGKHDTDDPPEQAARAQQERLHKQQLQQQLQHQQLQQQQLQQLQQQQLQQQQLQQQQLQHLQQQQMQQLQYDLLDSHKIDRQKQAAILTVLNVCEQQKSQEKKQTWEQALAHMNQLAKGNKEKKKKEHPKPEVKPEPARSQSLPDATQALSKKQRKLLAKQQAEEEEKRRLEAEEKLKKKESKADKKAEKKAEVKKEGKKEEKKETKKDKAEKKGKENKQEKNGPAATTKQAKTPAQPSKKEKKKEPKPHLINITPDTTIEVVGKKGSCNSDLENPASCSIMEQLSCGVQVADLRLPPGITLTRVQPCEKREPPPIKSVPVWKCSQLSAAPTPVARPQPVINADPSMMMFSTAQPEPPKSIVIPEPTPAPAGKSKKAKKKAKKAAAAPEKPDGNKMVTLRNPMFHPNLPPVQVNTPVQKKEQVRIPEPMPMTQNACQATITPTSNGMYTIRNPLMSMMHQQSLMGLRQTPNPMYNQPQYNYVNPNTYTPVQQQNYIDPAASPKNDEFQSRIMNLASFTQKNDNGYSLFKTSDSNSQRNFLAPEFYDTQPKPTVSPNPIGTRPERNFESESLFTNPIQRPEPIGTPINTPIGTIGQPKVDDKGDYSSLYTPFGQEDKNVFRDALFSDRTDCMGKLDAELNMANGDPLPYFQRLRVGSKLNNEVTIHHVTESKFYKGQEGAPDESLFSRGAWPEPHNYAPPNTGVQSCNTSPTGASLAPEDEAGYGAVGQRHNTGHTESSVFLPDRTITNLSSLEVSEREIESFKRFEFYFDPPQHKPKVRLDVRDIANALRQNHK